MGYEIKELVEAADLAVCASLMIGSNPWNALYFTTEQCEEDLHRHELVVHGAVADSAVDEKGRILGFLASMKYGIGLEPMVEYLCIDEEFRGQGIGTALIAHFESELFPDADNLYLFVSDINPNAIRLYVRLGYQQIGALPNFNLEGQTEFLHRKSRRPRQLVFKQAQLKSSNKAENTQDR